jgi:hypothetical protein
MSASTGPVVAAGTITLFTDVIVRGQPLATDAKVIVGTGIAALGLFGLEQVAPRTAVAMSWLILVSVLFVKHGNKPSPAEAFNKWYGSNGKGVI